jgi:hypothetical protein
VLLTGGEIVAEHLVRRGVPYLVGIPGHGCLALLAAIREGRPYSLTGLEGREVLQFSLAAHRSAREARPVRSTRLSTKVP